MRLLFEAGQRLDPEISGIPSLPTGKNLNKRFSEFFARFLEIWNEHRTQYLETVFPKSPASRDRALQHLKTYAYWHIFITAWLHQHPQHGARRPYLYVDDFHAEIFPRLEVTAKTTKAYIDDMIAWGILERLGRNDGVPKNKFAVRMKIATFGFFKGAFVGAAELVAETAKDLSVMGAPPSSGAAILKFQANQ
jgi:hypothetical protein